MTATRPHPEMFRTVLDSLLTGVCVLDRQGKILLWNQGAERITGHRQHEVVGRFHRENILAHCDLHGCADCGASCPLLTMHDGKPRALRIRLRHREGHPVPVLMHVAAVRDEHGAIIAVAESFDPQRFATDKDRMQHNLAAYGCMDETTDLPNSGFTSFHLRENLASFSEYRLPFGILCIQVDHLENFRAAYGRRAGDAILRVVGQTMRGTLRPSDFLGRWADDQFLAILMNCGPYGVEKAFARIRRVVACAGLRWWGDELTVTTSVGFAVVQPADTIDSLLQRAFNSIDKKSSAQASGAAAASAAAAPGSGS